MGLLIAARDPESGDRLTAEELVDNVLTFVGAGHETTALALTWALYILAQAQDTQDALADEVVSVCGDNPVSAEDVARLPLHDPRGERDLEAVPARAADSAQRDGRGDRGRPHLCAGRSPFHRRLPHAPAQNAVG